jgi:putative transposase
LHARPYDAPARGKMERFWRRMREEALSHIGQVASLAEVECKLRDWLARYYQGAPHAGILGRAPAARYAEGEKVRVTEDDLRAALTVRARRRVRRDTTISVDGTVYEIPLGYLAGQTITVATSLFDGAEPVLELDGKRIALSVVDPTGNNKKPRPPRRPAPERPKNPVDFEPGRTLGSSSEEDSDDDIF